jgi:hypothetical protein
MYCRAAIGRRVFLSAFAFAPLLNAAQPFWNRKDPDAWSPDEVLQLTSRSPWAVSARVLPKPGRDKGSTQAAEPEVAGGRAGGRGTGPIPVVPVNEVVVVWASAAPLLDALKSKFPPDFANHYVISIAGLPPNPKGMTAKLLTKQKASVGAGGVEVTRTATLFAFSKELLPLSVADKEVTFQLETDQFSIRARFDLKEMRYHGTLAV